MTTIQALAAAISNELHDPSVYLGVGIYCTLAAAVLAGVWWAWGGDE